MTCTEFVGATAFDRELMATQAVPSNSISRGTQWSPPTGNTLKVNFDGAWIPGSCTGGIGVVIRDFNGVWCGGLSSPLICDSALVAEAAAGLCAITFAKERGMGKIILESDCKVVIDALCGRIGNNSWIIAPIIDEIHNLSLCLDAVAWNWVPRGANRAAHAVASIGLRAMELKSWVTRPPLSLVGVLNSDGLPCPPQDGNTSS